jgi:hypothetical protein
MTEGRVQLAMDDLMIAKNGMRVSVNELSATSPRTASWRLSSWAFPAHWGKMVWDTVVEDEGNRGAQVVAVAAPRPGEVLELRVDSDVPQSPGGHYFLLPHPPRRLAH